jgi:hypothetical protein
LSRKKKTTKVATEADRGIPLHSAPIPCLNVPMLLSRMQPWAQEKYAEARSQLSAQPHSQPAEVQMTRLADADVDKIVADGNAERVLDNESAHGHCICFTVVEDNKGDPRRRIITWSKSSNEVVRESGFRSCAPLFHTSHYLQDVCEPTACQFDLKLGFYQVPLTAAERTNFRFQSAAGEWYQLTRLPMGHCASVDVMQLLTMVLAGCHEVVLPQFRCPGRSPQVWVDGARFAGTKSQVTVAIKFFIDTAREANATLKHAPQEETSYEFVGVKFDHLRKEVSMGKKTRQQLPHSVPTRLTAQDLEQLVGRMIFGAGIVGEPLAYYYLAFKRVRRVLNALNRGLLTPDSIVDLSDGCARRLDALLKRALQTRKFDGAPSMITGTLFTDATPTGWGAVYFDNLGRVHVAGDQWTSADKHKHINVLEVAAVRMGLTAFATLLEGVGKLELVIDNTSAEHSIRKGNSKSAELCEAVADACRAVQRSGAQVSIGYIRSAENPADGPSRQRPIMTAIPSDVPTAPMRWTTSDVAKHDWATWERRKLKTKPFGVPPYR